MTSSETDYFLIESAISAEDIKQFTTAHPEHSEYPLFYDDILPANIRGHDSGSEKFLDIVSRNVRRNYRNNRTINFIESGPLPSDPRRLHILVIVDNIGSGSQVESFLAQILRAHTQGSLGKHQVLVTALSWTSTKAGEARVVNWINEQQGDKIDLTTANKYAAPSIVLKVRSANHTETFHEITDKSLRNDLLDLFYTYPKVKEKENGKKQKKEKENNLGFGGTASRLVMLGSSCPNNVPPLFWKDGKLPTGGNYNPIFKSKNVPSELQSLVVKEMLPSPANGAVSVSASINSFAVSLHERLKKERLVQAAKRISLNGTEDPTWAILLFAVAKFSRDDAIKGTACPYDKFRKSEKVLKEFGWLDKNFTATPRAEYLVRRFGRKSNYLDYATGTKYLKTSLDASGIVYYPNSVGGVE